MRFLKLLPILLIAVLPIRPSSADDLTLHVVVNGAPPYRIILHDEGTRLYTGIYIDILKEAARRNGLFLNFKEVPFLRALILMENGAADIMLGPLRRPEREAYMEYLAPPLPKEDKVLFLRYGIKDVNDFKDLYDLKVGILPGAKYNAAFDKDERIEKVIVPSYTSALKMLQSGRIDVAIMPERQGDYISKASGMKLKKASLRFPGADSFITFSNLSPQRHWKEKLSATLQEMQNDGTYDKILSQYR